MKNFAFLFFTCVQFATAQKPATTVENFNIHHAKDGDEDLSSDFPIAHTGNAAADKKVNDLLQTRFFGSPLDEKTRADVRKNFDPAGNDVFSFDTQITARFVSVVIRQHRLNNSMSLNGYDMSFPFLFDPRSGQRFSPISLFSDEGAILFLGKSFRGLRESYNQTMDRYLEGFSKLKPAAQAEKCECDCESILQDVFRDNLVAFHFSNEGLSLTMDACSWQNPGPHDVYSFFISMGDLRPWLSEYGKYMIDGGPVAPYPAESKMLFQGKLGDNINTTFVLERQPGNGVAGFEIYNRIGTAIKLRGTVDGTQFTFDELSPEGNPVATFKTSFDGNNMNGTWMKADKSRTMPFTAVKYQ